MKSTRTMPSAILSHDSKRLLDQPTLVQLIRELMRDIGNPRFTDTVILTISAPIIQTSRIHLAEQDSIKEVLESRLSFNPAFKEQSPVLQYQLLWQHGESASVAYAALGNRLIRDVVQAFHEAGLKITLIDLLPLSVLRSMAASGVLDALLRRIGKDEAWGCFGVSGSLTWVSLWKGRHLVHMESFTTPADAPSWEDHIQDAVKQANSKPPAFWFAWAEPDSNLPINPLKLNLGVPLRQAMLGPMFGKPPMQPSFSALGAALKRDVAFPIEWNFMQDIAIEPIVQKQLETVPYSNYQPVIPKFVLLASILLFLAVSAGSLYLWLTNGQTAEKYALREAQVDMAVADIHRENQLYTDLFAWVNRNAIEGIQFDALFIQSPGKLRLAGKAHHRPTIERFLSLLTGETQNSTFQIKKLKQTIYPAGGQTPLFNFEFFGQVDRKDKLK